MPRVSVVATVYNLQDIVLETVHSILRQTFTDLELIVVDDGSTDASADLIEAIGDPRLTLIRAEHTGLPAAGLSRAYENSTGELIAVTGADDVSLPQRIAREVEFFDRHPSVGMVHSGFHHLIEGEVSELPLRCNEPETTSAAAMLPKMIVNNIVCTPTAMLRRSVIERVGGLFDTDPLLCGPEDFDLWLRLCEAGIEFGFIAEPLVHYRIRRNSVSRNLMRNWRGNLRAFEKAHARSPELYRGHEKLVRGRMSRINCNVGRLKLIEGEAGGLADIWRAVRFSPLSVKPWAWMCLALCGHKVTRAVVAVRDKANAPPTQRPTSKPSTV